MNLELIAPRLDFEAEFMALVEEFRALGERRFEGEPGLRQDDFAAYVRWLQDGERGQAHDDWFGGELVPWSSYWLVEKGSGVPLGVASLRHRLTPFLLRQGGHIGYAIRPSARGRGLGSAILKLTLAKAREMKLPRVLLVCSSANLSSARIIEKGGGQLENQIMIEVGHGEGARQVLLSRYWIELSSNESAST